MSHTALWFLKSQIIYYSDSLSPKLPQTYRQTVPQTRPCNSKASITKSVDYAFTAIYIHVEIKHEIAYNKNLGCRSQSRN